MLGRRPRAGGLRRTRCGTAADPRPGQARLARLDCSNVIRVALAGHKEIAVPDTRLGRACGSSISGWRDGAGFMRGLPALAASSLGSLPLPPPEAAAPAEAESVDEEMERGSCVTCLLSAAIALASWLLAQFQLLLHLNQLLHRGVGLRLVQQAVFRMRHSRPNPRAICSGLAKRPENPQVHSLLCGHCS